MKPITCLFSQPTGPDIFERFSSLNVLVRIIARCLRWRKKKIQTRTLQISELKEANLRILNLIQQHCFSMEINKLQRTEELPAKSKLLCLAPFLDSQGLLCVGGRLKNINLSENQRHPILLPKSHHVTKLIIERAHYDGFHAGIQTTLYQIRQNYWLIDGRNQVRKVIRNCIRCARINPGKTEPSLGQLPAVRLNIARPFTNVGVDYCGPFYIKEKKLRNRNRIKAYISIFICLVTKAVHIEVVSDLTTEGFLAALRRMFARRGYCNHIYSDNGTNFVGAFNELKELYALFQSQEHHDKLQRQLADRQISWHFNPPYSPHFGGIWEAAVKSFKHHFRRVAGNELFTFEQFNTLAIEIEFILNSRPLTPLSSDPNDILALTPSRFLIGDSLSNLPEQDFSDTSTNRLSTWQHIQRTKQDFWKRWTKEYINELNIREKWSKECTTYQLEAWKNHWANTRSRRCCSSCSFEDERR